MRQSCFQTRREDDKRHSDRSSLESISRSTSFLLDKKKGGPVRYIKDKEVICLAEEQMRHIYEKIESGSEINIDTMRQEIDNDKLTEAKTEEEEIILIKR